MMIYRMAMELLVGIIIFVMGGFFAMVLIPKLIDRYLETLIFVCTMAGVLAISWTIGYHFLQLIDR